MTIKQIHQTHVLSVTRCGTKSAGNKALTQVKDTIFPSAVKSKFLLRCRDVSLVGMYPWAPSMLKLLGNKNSSWEFCRLASRAPAEKGGSLEWKQERETKTVPCNLYPRCTFALC